MYTFEVKSVYTYTVMLLALLNIILLATHASQLLTVTTST